MKGSWYEVWADDSAEYPYLLLVVPGSGQEINVCDPQKKNQMVYSAKTYQDAMYWLTEDEYTRVCDRMES